MLEPLGAILPILAALLVTLSAICLLAVSDWRASAVFLSLMYLGIFVLTAQSWPLAMAMTRLVAGWIATAILGMAATGLRAGGAPAWKGTSPLFSMFTALLAGSAALSQIGEVQGFLPGVSFAQAWGALMLISLGIVKIGFSEGVVTHNLQAAAAFPSVVGLLTALAGFGVLIPALNAAPLTAGLLAAIDLSMALAGAYLMLAPTMESSA